MYRTQFLAFTLALCTTSSAFAEILVQTVAGTYSNGAPVTIQGKGFGSKLTPTPKIWDQFTAGSNGDLLSTVGWKIDSDNPVTDRPQLSDANLRFSEAKFSARFHFTRGTTPLQDLAYKDNLPVSGKKRYVDYWIWYKMPNQDPSYLQHQLKLLRLISGPGAEVRDGAGPGLDGWPSLNTFAWRYNSGSRSTYYPVGRTTSNTTDYYASTNLVDGKWNHVRVQLDVGNEGQTDGNLRVWFNEQLALSKTDIKFIETGYGAVNWYNNLHLGKYLGNDTTPSSGSPAETTAYYSEVYYDDSWSRVVIGDSSTYSSCTHTEVQPYSYWSDSLIKINLNKGSFNVGDTAYLYIVDEFGNPGPAQKITFVSSGPTPPVNLKATPKP